jgi:hypothetical protein
MVLQAYDVNARLPNSYIAECYLVVLSAEIDISRGFAEKI